MENPELNFLREAARNVLHIVESEMPFLLSLDEGRLSTLRNGQGRTVKQVVGHLVDSASNNHQRMVRLQYSQRLDFPDYRQDNDLWISLQDYQSADWNGLVTLWEAFNRHIAHLISVADISCLANVWTDFEGTTVTLREMIAGYPQHMEMHIGEIHDMVSRAGER